MRNMFVSAYVRLIDTRATRTAIELVDAIMLVDAIELMIYSHAIHRKSCHAHAATYEWEPKYPFQKISIPIDLAVQLGSNMVAETT